MKEICLPDELVSELEDIYHKLQGEYERVAGELNFSCEGCPDNCCDSYFLHHTYAEWAYLWVGVKQLPEEKQQALVERAKEYLLECEKAERRGERPQVQCPLLDGGLCLLYKHRLLVCRTHGVPASMTRPDGKSMQFPGCFRCQEIVDARPNSQVPHVERTPLLRRLAQLENNLFDGKRHLAPKVRMTLAEMLVKGPPALPPVHCERDRH
jgi:hypothetical protein